MLFRPAATFCSLAFCLFSGSAAVAQECPITLPDDQRFVLRHWGTAGGLPQNSVNDLLPHPDGTLWLATFGGLCQFDGTVWRVLDAASQPALADSRMHALTLADDRRLWSGSELGVVSLHTPDGVRPITRLPTGPVNAMVALDANRLVCTTPADVFVVDDRGTHTPWTSTPLPSVRIAMPAGDGSVLLGGKHGLWRWRDGKASRLLARECTSAVRAGDGTVWVASVAGLHRITAAAGAADETPAITGLAGTVQTVTLAAGGEALWYGTDRELGRLPLAGSAPVLRVPTTAPVSAIREDRTGGVWIGFHGSGLVRLFPAEAFGIDLGTADGQVLGASSVLGDRDDGWVVGTAQGAFAVPRQGPRVGPLTPQREVHGLLRDRDGSLWLGGRDVLGQLVGRDYRSWQAPAPVGPIRAIVRAADDTLLLATEQGVLAFDQTFAPWPPAAPLRGRTVKLLLPWPDGSLWLVGADEVLAVARDHRIVARLRRGQELPDAEVRTVLPGRGDRAWFGTYGAGFVGIGAAGTHRIGPEQGLVDAFVCAATPTAHGWLVGGNRGPLLLDPASLDDVADGNRSTIRCRQLTCAGRIATEANGGVQPAATTAGEHAALCSVGGVLEVRLERLAATPPPPVCQVRIAVNGDQRLEPAGADEVLTTEWDRTVVFTCFAPEFDLPETMRYRWRLAGAAWSELTSLRSGSLVLPGPGEFVLEVEAIGNGDRRSATPTRVRVRVTPVPWERWSVRLFALVLLAALIWLGFRFGAHRARRRAAQLQTLVDARTHELTLARDQLEQRVHERTLALQQALADRDADHARSRALERELDQMRRMESLGQLAGSVAHDFNNLLTVVIGNLHLLQAAVGAEPRAGTTIQRALAAATHGRDLTQRLLAVASRQAAAPTTLDVGAGLRRQLGVLRDLLGARIRVDLQIDDEPLLVRAAAGQIDQILLNLAANAGRAMPDGGALSIHARRNQHGAVALVVADTGTGMTDEVRRRAFEPFFSTGGGRGSGLGLAIVHGITRQLGGEVTLTSAPGQGTRFQFTFPAAREPAPTAAPAPTPVPRPAAPGGRRRLLLIEDEADVRTAMRLLLDAWGYDVVADADCGASALHQLGEVGIAVDGVVSDVCMPGVQGVELVQALRRIRPRLPIVFVSGHTSSASLAGELHQLGIELVGKPPSRETMSAALERMFAAGAKPSGPPG